MRILNKSRRKKNVNICLKFFGQMTKPLTFGILSGRHFSWPPFSPLKKTQRTTC